MLSSRQKFFATFDKSNSSQDRKIPQHKGSGRQRLNEKVLDNLTSTSEQTLNKTKSNSKYRINEANTFTNNDHHRIIPKIKKKSMQVEVEKEQDTANKEFDYQTERKKKFEQVTKATGYMSTFNNNEEFMSPQMIQSQLFNCKTLESLLKIYQQHKFTFSTKNLTNCLHKIAKIYPIENKKHHKMNNIAVHKKAFKYSLKENRIQLLLFNIEQNLKMFNLDEKTIICIFFSL